jgi:hypothetical protein
VQEGVAQAQLGMMPPFDGPFQKQEEQLFCGELIAGFHISNSALAVALGSTAAMSTAVTYWTLKLQQLPPLFRLLSAANILLCLSHMDF